MIEVYKAQESYTFTHLEGILFGYKFPKYLKDVNMDDFHLHFLSTDKTKGGHLIWCTFSKGTVSVAYFRNYSLQLPDNIYFNTTNFTNKKSELLKIEGGKNWIKKSWFQDFHSNFGNSKYFSIFTIKQIHIVRRKSNLLRK